MRPVVDGPRVKEKMRQDDLKLISDLGKALYANPELARSRSIETVAAVSTLERLSDEQAFEKVSFLLLKQAEKEAVKSAASGVTHPFYRLSVLERGVLAFLHSGRISYQRLARILNVDTFLVEKLAWSARMKLASSPEVRADAPHPVGSSKIKHQCPEYHPERPWTQRLLDDEMKHAELLMIQNHTVACQSCLRALSSAREFYYAVEKWIPTLTESTGDEISMADLRRAQLRSGIPPSDVTFMDALSLVFQRTDVRIAVGIFFVTLLLKIFV